MLSHGKQLKVKGSTTKMVRIHRRQINSLSYRIGLPTAKKGRAKNVNKHTFDFTSVGPFPSRLPYDWSICSLLLY